MFVREGVNFGGKELSIETGRMAKQADGAVLVRYGDTMVLVTAVAATSGARASTSSRSPVDYVEKTSAAGKIPGGFFKREGRQTRGRDPHLAPHRPPVAPALPQGLALRHAGHRHRRSRPTSENATDVLAMTGASAALHISDIPWAGPFAGVRVGRIDGKFVVNPTFAAARRRRTST